MKSIKQLFNNSVFAVIIMLCWMVGVAWAADTKLSALSELTDVDGEDLVYVIDDPSGTPASRNATVNNAVEGAIDDGVTLSTGAYLQTGTTDGNTFLIKIYDANGTTYRTITFETGDSSDADPDNWPRMDLGANIAITGLGSISAGIVPGPDITGNDTFVASDLNQKYTATAAATLTLPNVDGSTVPYGQQLAIRVRDAAETLIIDADASDKINLHGTALDTGDSIDSPGNAGDFIILLSTTDADGTGTDGWETWGYGEAEWTDGGAS